MLNACKYAVICWDEWGAWPDNWSLWQRALDDAAIDHSRRFGISVPLRKLEEIASWEEI